MNVSTVQLRRKLGMVVAAALVTLLAAAGKLPSPAAANPTATAPTQLVHAFPLGPQRLCCTTPATSQTTSRRAPTRGSGAAPRHSPARHNGESNGLVIVVLGAVIALLIGGVSATYGVRRRRVTAALGAEIAANRRATTEAARSAVGGGSGWHERVWAGRFSPFGERARPSRDEVELPAGSIRATGVEIGALERAYRRADAAGHATGAFNLGVLLHQRGNLPGAREAYERAERRGDADAAFNHGVLLYEAGDLDGAEAAWRRCVARGHPRAAANLRFLMQQRGAPPGATETEATESAERAYRRADQAGEAVGTFNLGVLLHQRGDLSGAREAYERAERRGDPDAVFNLGVLLYEAGDLEAAEAAWRRSSSRGHAQAVENLRFLEQRRGAPARFRETAGAAGATDPGGRA